MSGANSPRQGRARWTATRISTSSCPRVTEKDAPPFSATQWTQRALRSAKPDGDGQTPCPRTPRASNGREVACPSRARQTAEKRSAWFFMARSRFARFLPAPDMALVFVRCAVMTPGVWVRPAGLRPAAAPRSARRSPCAPPTRNLGCAHPARERPPTQGGACPALLGAAEHLLLSDGVTGVQRAPPAPPTLSPPRCGSSRRTRGHRGVPSSGACMGWRDGTR